MSRTSVALAALAVLALAPPLAAAGYHYGFDNDDKDNLGWVIVSGGHNSSSDLGHEDLEGLKDRFGRDFLYIRDGDERFVIRDRGLIRRAQDGLKPMEEAGREIGEAVGAKVGYSMRRSEGARERARLARRISRLDRRIAREEGEDREELESEREELQQRLDQLKDDRRERHDTEEREAELDAATERASRHMRDAARKQKQQLRDILREAKSRHLAESVED